MKMIEQATGDNFSLGSACDAPFFRPAPAAFVRVYMVAFLFSRFGLQDDGAATRRSVVTPRFAVFFGLPADDPSVGMTCQAVVAAAGLEWPQSLYKTQGPGHALPGCPPPPPPPQTPGACSGRDEVVQHTPTPRKRSRTAATTTDGGPKIDVFVLDDSSDLPLETLVLSGRACPLLYEPSSRRSGPWLRGLAVQLVVAALDRLVPQKGYRAGGCRIQGEVANPLLGVQELIVHPHLAMYLALLVYKCEKTGPRSEPLTSCKTVSVKLKHFLGQTMAMEYMTIEQVRESGLPGTAWEKTALATTEPWAHRDSLQRSREGVMQNMFRFRAGKWWTRNMHYQRRVRQYVSGSSAPRAKHAVRVGTLMR